MTLATPTLEIFKGYPRVQKIWKLQLEWQEKIAKLEWWEIIKRIKLKRELGVLRHLAFGIGLETGIDILEKCGIVKKVKVNKN